ncbi:MAG: hypothetical protein EBT79_10475 [Actinobacteria bacterium]|nr:hypothetical protein [Actinomycetota bacterium]NBR67677.1 hypothetical protein [Actinomycetota bacterium]
MKQAEYIQRAIEQLNAQRTDIPEAFSKEAREIDAAIEALVLSSNNGPQIVALRMKKESIRTEHTAKIAMMNGQITALTEVFNRYHQNPVPPGTVVHGIDVSVLDWETRARVMAGDVDTIAVLGGTLDRGEYVPPAEGESTVAPKAKAKR